MPRIEGTYAPTDWRCRIDPNFDPELYPYRLYGCISIFPFAIIQDGAEIGSGTKVESFCFVEVGAKIGERVTLKPGVYVWKGIELDDDVFVGPNVTFTNDDWPRVERPCPVEHTTIGHGASIGAGAVILSGSVIPPHSMVAAGAIVGGMYPAGVGLRFGRDGLVHSVDKIREEQEACERCRRERRTRDALPTVRENAALEGTPTVAPAPEEKVRLLCDCCAPMHWQFPQGGTCPRCGGHIPPTQQSEK